MSWSRARRLRGLHRGPDDYGVWGDPAVGVGLTQRRLSIIDLAETGHQPMASRDGRFMVVYNGEIYNYRELRVRLESAGQTFLGHSDTLVITEGCSAWGFDRMLSELNGMFAIAVWDRRERVLHFARDRMGEKPLYYGRFGSSVLFGSELKALLAHPGWSPTLDSTAANLYFTYNYVPGPRTIFQGVYKLQPAHRLSIPLDSALPLPQPSAYWSVVDVAADGMANPSPADAPAALEALDELMNDAVRIRLESDVPIGALPSGGIDSSLIVALMQKHATGTVKTFSVGFEDRAYDESAHARRVADHLGTDHTEFRVTPGDALAVVPELPKMYDEPFADSSQIPTHLMSKLQTRAIAVLGMGAIVRSLRVSTSRSL